MSEDKIAFDPEKTVRLSGIVPESVVDGKGIRFTVFTQGCPHGCAGCHNPQTHEFGGGKVMKIGEIAAMIEKNPLLDGITFSGGEPFVFAGSLSSLASFVHGRGMNVWCYTGYTFDELSAAAQKDPAVEKLLRETDVLVDGRFEEDKLDLTLKFRGSSNQRVIDLNKTRETGGIVLIK